MILHRLCNSEDYKSPLTFVYLNICKTYGKYAFIFSKQNFSVIFRLFLLCQLKVFFRGSNRKETFPTGINFGSPCKKNIRWREGVLGEFFFLMRSAKTISRKQLKISFLKRTPTEKNQQQVQDIRCFLDKVIA